MLRRRLRGTAAGRRRALLNAGTRAAFTAHAAGALRVRKAGAGDQRCRGHRNQEAISHRYSSSVFIARADNEARGGMFRNNSGFRGFLW
jgi:hypothetical protein